MISLQAKSESENLNAYVKCAHETKVADRATGEEICSTCGLVLGQNTPFETVSTWNKTHNVPSIVTRSISTHLGGFGERMNLNGETGKTFRRMHKYQNPNIDRNTKTLRDTSTYLNTLTEASVRVSSRVKTDAFELFRRCWKAGLLKGISAEELALACLYYMIRAHGSAIDLQTLAEKSGVPKSVIGDRYRKKLLIEMGLKSPKTSFRDNLKKIDAKMNYPPEVTATINEISNAVHETKMHIGKNPSGLAAAIIYLAYLKNRTKLGFSISQNLVAQIANTSEQTVRQNGKVIRESISLTFPDSHFLKPYAGCSSHND